LTLQNYTYLIIDLACIIIPFAASFYPRHPFYKEWKFFMPANLIVGTLFLVWDYFFTEAGIWGFNPKYLSGIYISNLPIEEVLFFISIPYACVFTWFAFRYLIKSNPLDHLERGLTILLVVILSVLGFANLDKWYTGATFLSTAAYLLANYYFRSRLSWIYLSYIAIIPFFVLSNGILTGSWLDEPIVWYNNAENLGIRIGTIPAEDSVYGFLLIMMNIQLYNYFKNRIIKKAVE